MKSYCRKKTFGNVVGGLMLLAGLVVVGNGCGKSKEPPPGGGNEAPPMVDLGPASNQGAAEDPGQSGAGQEARESGIKGEGQAAEEQAPNTGSR